jgi:inner membrane protein YidH
LTIRNYCDHAANERTFLEWVRTSIAITAFGFLVECFDIFLSLVAPAALHETIPVRRSEFGRIAGLILILIGVGVVMVVLAAIRFIRTRREIEEQRIVPGTGARLDVALTALLTLLGIALLFYVSRAVAQG